MPKRAALILPLATEWTGGQNYVFNLAKILSEMPEFEVLVISTEEQPPPIFQQSELVFEFHQHRELRRLRNPIDLVTLVLTKQAKHLSDLLVSKRVDVVFSPTLYIGKVPGARVVTWIPDLQHIKLPELFPLKQRLLRHFSYSLCANHSDRVMLSSKDAYSTYRKHFSDADNKVSICPFTPLSMDLQSSEYINEVLDRYGLKRPFLYVPNQFWKHKNHSIFLKALALPKMKDWQHQFVFSGTPVDDRDPAYVENLTTSLGDPNENRTRLLGQIPRRDVIALMQSCNGVVNPSFFEGRSTIVEEAIALNTPLLLSDIPIHREQAETVAEFFEPTDPDSFASLAISSTRYVRELSLETSKAYEERKSTFEESLEKTFAFPSQNLEK